MFMQAKNRSNVAIRLHYNYLLCMNGYAYKCVCVCVCMNMYTVPNTTNPLEIYLTDCTVVIKLSKRVMMH